jgi:hypothetical protein
MTIEDDNVEIWAHYYTNECVDRIHIVGYNFFVKLTDIFDSKFTPQYCQLEEYSSSTDFRKIYRASAFWKRVG